MISYFISYTFTNETGSGFGNCQIDLQYPTRSHRDITVVTEILSKQVPGRPVVMSFSRFDGDADDGGATR